MTDSSPSDVQESANRASYASADAVSHYPQQSDLHPAERALFERYGADLRGKKLLDIGVGGGRTTAHLSTIAADYVGIDYSPDLVTATASRFPTLDIREGDARDLGSYRDSSFDTVIFSFNGIDYISHEDRLTAQSEIRRVLREGGVFIFSSHNRQYHRFHQLPWQGRPKLGRQTIRHSLQALKAHQNRRRLRSYEVIKSEWAIINDDAHKFSMLTYYVAAGESRRQLVLAGFSEVETFNLAGQVSERDDSAPWLYYAARI